MRLLSIYVGTGVDVLGKTIQLAEALDIIDAIRADLTNLCGGCTTVDGIGTWTDPDTQSIVHEQCTIFSVATTLDDDACLELASTIADMARQKSVMVVLPNGNVEFVPA